MTTGLITQVGTTVSLTKALSSADVALFTLVADDLQPAEEDPAKRVSAEEERARVPSALLAALMTSAALKHAGGHAAAEIEQVEVRFAGDAWVGDTLTATAAVAASDPATGTLRVQAHCANEAGAPLADGQIILRARV